jgi:hypothetical protein
MLSYDVSTSCNGLACVLTRSVTNGYTYSIKILDEYIYETHDMHSVWRISGPMSERIKCYWSSVDTDTRTYTTIPSNDTITASLSLNRWCNLNPCINKACTLTVAANINIRNVDSEEVFLQRIEATCLVSPYTIGYTESMTLSGQTDL